MVTDDCEPTQAVLELFHGEEYRQDLRVITLGSWNLSYVVVAALLDDVAHVRFSCQGRVMHVKDLRVDVDLRGP